MAERRFDILFDGSVINGHNIADVKSNLKVLFKLDDSSIDKLFSGKPIAIKKNLDRQSATQYQTALTQAGAKIQLVLHRPATEAPTPSKTAPQAEPGQLSNESNDTSLSLLPVGSDLLAQSEKPQATAANINVDHITIETVNPFMVDDPAMPASQQTQDSSSTAGYRIGDDIELNTTLTVAEVGSAIGTDTSERQHSSIDINTDYLDIDPLGTYLLENNKSQDNEAPDIHLETSQFTLCDPGTEILTAEERQPYKTVEVDTSALTLSDDNT